VSATESERAKDQGQKAREAASARINEALERERKAKAEEDARESERKAMAEKYEALNPERRSAFQSGDEISDDLASDTFSNGEEAEMTSIEEEIRNAERTNRLIQLQKPARSGRRGGGGGGSGNGKKPGHGQRRRN
jgi:hypothetical protein